MIRKCMLLGVMLALGLLAWSQNKGLVTVSASPEVICHGASTVLHAEAETDEIIDFETGNFIQYPFVNDVTYPWTVVAADNGSSYCMKSGNAGVASTTSTISATSFYSQEGYVAFSFFARGESTTDSYDWDVCRFYIDDALQFQYGRHTSWETFAAEVSSGTHTFTWVYKKDSTVDPDTDAFFVDNIVFSYNSTAISGQQLFDFENHTLQGWTTIDADGDGFNWRVGTDFIYNEYGYVGFTGHNGSSDIVASQSYYKISEDEGYALFPDNYLVSPSKMLIKNGAYISFWACAQDYLWAGEHFGVAVSTGSNGNANGFTTIQQWTMTSKDAGSPAKATRSGDRYMGNWYKYTVDLSAYVGQRIWVALRHFNCSDYFYLDVDDITLYEGSDSSDNDDITYQWSPGNMTGQNITVSPTQTTTYTVTVLDGNGTVIGTAQQTVAVDPAPEVNISTDTGETAVCEEETITLYASVSGTDHYQSGDILCTDGSVVHASDWPCGKTAQGIVFYVDDTGQHGWAIDLGQNVPTKKWSTENKEVPGLRSYDQFMNAIVDLDGYSNTQKIRLFGTAAKYPAAWEVDFAHGWYLPAIGQLNILYGAIIVVNASMDRVGGATIETGDLWSSSAHYYYDNNNTIHYDKSWMMRTTNGYVGADPKSSQKRVRSVTNF